MIVIGPRPLLPEGAGMQAVFFWIWPGIAGMVLAAAGVSRIARANALIATALALSWLLYLSYRDLHSYGLWRYNNVHYFKWSLPFLAFWACDLIRRLARTDLRPAAIAATLSAACLFTWRPEFQPLKSGQLPAALPRNPHQATIPAALSPIARAIMIQTDGDWQDIYYTRPNTLHIGKVMFPTVGDVKLFPGPGAALIVPLRPLPKGDVTIDLPASAHFPPAARWQSGRQILVLGLPCFVAPHRQACGLAEWASWRAPQNPL